MKPSHIGGARMVSQALQNPRLGTPLELLNWMGALQAQDWPMAQWALGVRLPGISRQEVEAAYNRGEVLRTHVLRPTWHLVSPENIRWMLALTAPQVRRAMASRHRDLELTDQLVNRVRDQLVRSLEGRQSKTRDELGTELAGIGLTLGRDQLSHLTLLFELETLICSGSLRGKKTTYALLEERVPSAPGLDRDEALARLAGLYFRSHGPATAGDFAWWSGLPAADVRRACELVGDRIHFERIGESIYGWDPALAFPKGRDKILHLLPAYDEFVIAYADRSAILDPEHRDRTISSNGLFRPVMVREGRVVGLWKPVLRGREKVPELQPFDTVVSDRERQSASEPWIRFQAVDRET